MANLEKMQGPPAALLEAAAQILGLNLVNLTSACSHETIYKKAPRSHGFKEQWVLRWLLRTLGVSDAKSKNEGEKLHNVQRAYGLPHPLLIACF